MPALVVFGALSAVFRTAVKVVTVGFSGLIHRVAKLRASEDARAAEDIQAEAF